MPFGTQLKDIYVVIEPSDEFLPLDCFRLFISQIILYYITYLVDGNIIPHSDSQLLSDIDYFLFVINLRANEAPLNLSPIYLRCRILSGNRIFKLEYNFPPFIFIHDAYDYIIF